MPAKKELALRNHNVPIRATRQPSKMANIPNENDVQSANLQVKASEHVTTRRAAFATRVLLERRTNSQQLVATQDKPTASVGIAKPKPSVHLEQSPFGGGNMLIDIEFATDIDAYLRHLEEKQALPENFLSSGKVDGRMRAILVDWLVHVQRRFSLLDETLSVAVWILDRALLRVPVDKGNLQLLGVSCLFVASKFEEITVPNIKDFVYVAADVFTKRDVLRMEQTVFQAIGFELSIPLPLQFIRRFRYFTMAPKNVHNLTKFIAEVALLAYPLAHLKASTVAAVSHYLAAYILEFNIPSSLYTEVMHMDESTLHLLACKFAEPVLQMADPQAKQYALRDKYAKEAPVPFPKAQLKRLEMLAKNVGQ